MTTGIDALSVRRLFIAVAAWSTVFWSSSQARAEGRATAPAWTLKDADGRTVRLADFQGKVVVLNFWATWCPPCQSEIPGFIALQDKYRSRGVVFVGVAMDEEAQAVVPFARKAGINYPVVFGTVPVAVSYGGVSVIPTTFLIGRDGKIAAVHESAFVVGALEAAIVALL